MYCVYQNINQTLSVNLSSVSPKAHTLHLYGTCSIKMAFDINSHESNWLETQMFAYLIRFLRRNHLQKLGGDVAKNHNKPQ
jgi:hypothetical protein